MNILGIDAIKSPLEVRKKIGVVLQQPSYEPTLSVEKSLEKYGMMWNVEKNIRKDRVEELLTSFDLADIRKKKNDDLSIGQRRRVQVAREFMHDMELVFTRAAASGNCRNCRKACDRAPRNRRARPGGGISASRNSPKARRASAARCGAGARANWCRR